MALKKTLKEYSIVSLKTKQWKTFKLSWHEDVGKSPCQNVSIKLHQSVPSSVSVCFFEIGSYSIYSSIFPQLLIFLPPSPCAGITGMFYHTWLLKIPFWGLGIDQIKKLLFLRNYLNFKSEQWESEALIPGHVPIPCSLVQPLWVCLTSIESAMNIDRSPLIW